MTVAIIGTEVEFNNVKNLCSNADAHSFINFADTDGIIEKVDIIFDFDYENRVDRLSDYYLKSNYVFLNAVVERGTKESRFNGWNSFYEKAPLEVVVKNEEEEALIALGIAYTNVADICGMLTARVVSMIINEAYFALGENVSTKEEIDTAMKLGTNYPYGPFEWAEKIGLSKIYHLLSNLSDDERYTPAPALINEINKA